MMKIIVAVIVLFFTVCTVTAEEIPSNFCSLSATGNYSDDYHNVGLVRMFRVGDYARYDFLESTGSRIDFSFFVTPSYFYRDRQGGCDKYFGFRRSDYRFYEREGDFDVFKVSIRDGDSALNASFWFNHETHEIERESFLIGYYYYQEYFRLIQSIDITYDNVDHSFIRRAKDKDKDHLFDSNSCFIIAEEADSIIQCTTPKTARSIFPDCGYVLNQTLNYYSQSTDIQQRVIANEDILLVKATKQMEKAATLLVRCDIKDSDGRCFYMGRRFNKKGAEIECFEDYAALNSRNFSDFLNALDMGFKFIESFIYYGEPDPVLCPDGTPDCKRYTGLKGQDIIVDKDGRVLAQGAESVMVFLDIVPSADDFAYSFCNGSKLEAPTYETCVAPFSLPSTLLIAVISLFSLILIQSH